jgi:hypothetical protein
MIFTPIQEPTVTIPGVFVEDCIALPGNETITVPVTPGGTGGRILATQDSQDVLTQGGLTILLQ